ncbi:MULTISPECIES: copper resistance system multicopper oxidase [Caulobacter]|jgi:CopA family copper-resistance protein|uniref:Copper-resistance protein, CopA family n=1 Tax=Caulobacter vibrioides OR37 TaxID=1292034 RepID=R0E9R0_CAUVI|nr:MULTISPECIES: copper resistance system multicopper oxidase [Caulobacter]ENZ78117.1 copper-resistance protein, CopA family [Caulobacter vibrioides OR37]MBQ1562007.1 copper resistance system multicopper oxidase [Caulobacter sp.]
MTPLDRRTLLRGALGLSAAGLLPGWAMAAQGGRSPEALSGDEIKLTVGHTMASIDGRTGHAVAVNGTIPGPLIRLKEGQRVRLAVTNTLDEETSIHWHGLLVPFAMDGVPGVSFPGIKPGETFTYDFPVRQSGTYWWHSHSGLQEQVGHYGPIIIDPAGEDPIPYDREHVVVLSDWSFLHPHQLIRKLKAQSGYFNHQKQTVAGLLKGRDQPLKDRVEWAWMRMDPTDILDVTGSTYTYLVNGHGPGDNWTGLFAPGERVRLRFINAGAMTIFNVRIPGLSLEVVAADGQPVNPVTVDEFQIAPAETFDVIVRPTQDKAFTLVAEASDRSGLARATLAPRPGMTAPVPPLRERPLATMKDMGMGTMGAMGHGGMDMPGMDMSMRSQANAPNLPLTPGVQTVSPMPLDRLSEPPQGLEDVGHAVLTYGALASPHPPTDTRPPERTVEIHLTGNMERFMWAFDGQAFGPLKKPIAFRRNERARVVLINDTMMAHPIHLHGHFFELVNGQERPPLKHTVNVAPGGKVAFDLTASEPGDWAFHCHLLLHMHAGMFNVVTVRPLDGEA